MLLLEKPKTLEQILIQGFISSFVLVPLSWFMVMHQQNRKIRKKVA